MACQVLTNCLNNFTLQSLCKPRIWITRKILHHQELKSGQQHKNYNWRRNLYSLRGCQVIKKCYSFLFVNSKDCKPLIKCKSLWLMIVKWVAQKIEECNSFKMPYQDHKQNHVGCTKQHGRPPVAHVCFRS